MHAALLQVPEAKFAKHRKTNFRQCYNIWKVYDRFTIKRDLQKIVRQCYEKVTTKVTRRSTTAH